MARYTGPKKQDLPHIWRADPWLRQKPAEKQFPPRPARTVEETQNYQRIRYSAEGKTKS